MNVSISEKEVRKALGRPFGEAEDAFGERFADLAEAQDLVDVAYAVTDSPLGDLLVAATPKGLVRVGLPSESADSVLSSLAEAISPRVLEMPKRLDDARRELDEYFDGRRMEFDLKLDWRLSPSGFYRQVLRQLPRVPFGQTVTYGEVAARAGSPKAYRAAGTACGANPMAIVVPCHRIIRSGGQLGNYGGGPEMKRYLLHHEGAI